MLEVTEETGLCPPPPFIIGVILRLVLKCRPVLITEGAENVPKCHSFIQFLIRFELCTYLGSEDEQGGDQFDGRSSESNKDMCIEIKLGKSEGAGGGAGGDKKVGGGWAGIVTTLD